MKPWEDYPKHPVDTSILGASINNAMGYDVGLVMLDHFSHFGVFVARGDGFFDTFHEVNDVPCYLETVSTGWKVCVRLHLISSDEEHVYMLGD